MKQVLCVMSAVSLVVPVLADMTFDDLKAAVAAAEDGAVIRITNDMAQESTLQVDKRITITSDEGGPYEIRRATGSKAFLELASASADVTLANVVFDGKKDIGWTNSVHCISITAGTLTLGNGAVIRNSAQTVPGTVFIDGSTSAKFVMNEGSEIRDCANNTYAAAVQVGNNHDKATFEMNGGLITCCASTKGTGGTDYGGAVYVWGGRFDMNGGAIVGNSGIATPGGVNVYCGSFYLAGDATVTNNVGVPANDIAKGKGGSVWIHAGWSGRATFYSAEEPVAGSQSPVWLCKVNGAYGKVCGCGNMACQDWPEYVIDGYYTPSVSYQGYTLWNRKVAEVVGRYDVATLAEAMKLLQDGDTLALGTNVVQASTLAFAGLKGITLTSAGEVRRCLTLGADKVSLVTVADGAEVRLMNVVLDGAGDEIRGTMPLADVQAGGTLTLGTGAVVGNTFNARGVRMAGNASCLVMKDGATITNCNLTSTTAYAAGVLVGDGKVYDLPPKFLMRGGLIAGCSCATTEAPGGGYGSTVYLYKGDMEMTGGLITGNFCEKSSSGLMNYNGNLRVSGTAEVRGNLGGYPDVYIIRNGGVGSSSIFGDFRGRFDVLTSTHTRDYSTGFACEEGATGAWCLHPIDKVEGKYEERTDLVGFTTAVDSTMVAGAKAIRWETVVGTMGDEMFASKADAELACPKTVKVPSGGLPIAVSGVALDIAPEIALDIDPDTVVASGSLPYALFTAPEGEFFTGGYSFAVPQPKEGKLKVVRRGNALALAYHNGGMCLILR